MLETCQLVCLVIVYRISILILIFDFYFDFDLFIFFLSLLLQINSHVNPVVFLLFVFRSYECNYSILFDQIQ